MDGAGSLMGTVNRRMVGQVPSQAPGRAVGGGGWDEEEDSHRKGSVTAVGERWKRAPCLASIG